MPNKYVSKKTRFRTRTGGRLRKRWYFNAGANLPIIGKTNVSFGSGLQKRSIVNLVRRRLEDPLHKTISNSNTNLLENTLYTVNLSGNIPQGDGDGNRSGDTIHIDALKIKLHFNTQDVDNKQVPVEYRVMIVKHDVDGQGGSDAWLSSTLGANDLFFGNNLIICEQTNSKKVTVLYDKICRITPQQNATSTCTLSEILRLNSTFTYKTGTNYGKFYNYYLVVAAHQQGATLGASVVGNCSIFTDLIFKDSR